MKHNKILSLVTGFIIGIGVIIMHYLGTIYSVKIENVMVIYDIYYVIISCIIAIVVSIVGVIIIFDFNQSFK